MKYIITKTSIWLDDEKPCEYAIYDESIKKWTIEIEDIHSFIHYLDDYTKKTKKPLQPDFYWGQIAIGYDKEYEMFEIEIIDNHWG